jgi:hypothetical protein
MTVAPGTPDPDLSRTLPDKLPVAWPYMVGETISARRQATTRSSILWDLLPVELSTDLGHVVPTIVRFIVKPLSTNRLGWLLHRLLCTGLLDCKNWSVESQRKFWWTQRFRGIPEASAIKSQPGTTGAAHRRSRRILAIRTVYLAYSLPISAIDCVGLVSRYLHWKHFLLRMRPIAKVSKSLSCSEAQPHCVAVRSLGRVNLPLGSGAGTSLCAVGSPHR